MPQLCFSGLVKTYGAARALDGVALDLRSGEVHALMGENGAGKSTLIRILAGIERADAGQITLDGTVLRLAGPTDAEAAGLRFLHQELQVVPGLSVAENMHLARPYPTRFGLVDWRALRQAARVALARLGVDQIDPDRAMAALGPGDQMLVRIAATLLTGGGRAPWLYVLDEPTAALTGAEAERLFGAIGALVAGGAGVLYVSHRIDEVLRLCHRVTVLRDGATVSSRAISATDRVRIIHDMTGRALSDLYPRRAGMVPEQPLLRVRGLAVGVVRGIDFDVQAGEILGLAGLSGSGRNAVLKALMGALPRGAGQVSLDERPLGTSPAQTWRQGLAYVPRERRSEGLMLWRALAETVTLPHLAALSRAGFLRQRHEGQRVAALGRAVGLKARGPSQPCAELSGGNQQKVLFARALAGHPRLLLLDEPTRGVDVGARFDIHALIMAFADQGGAVIVASSDLPELIGLCDRIAVLHAGRLGAVLSAAGLTEAGLLARCHDPLSEDA